jgi:protoheme IX farnesyltransferase
MTTDQPDPEKLTLRRFHYLALITAGLLYILIVVDEFARRTGAGLGYAEWLMAPTTLLIVLAAVSAWRSYRTTRWVSGPLAISLLVLVIQVILFGIRSNSNTNPGVLAAYLTSALIVHALVLTATVVAFRTRMEKADKLVFETPFARLTIIVLIFTFFTMVTGSVVTVTNAAAVCDVWPFCQNFMPTNIFEWTQVFHRMTVAISGVATLMMVIQAWRTQRFQVPILVLATSTGVLFFSQGLIGLGLDLFDNPLQMSALHAATAAAAWAISIVLVVQVGLAGRTAEGEALDAHRSDEIGARFKDYLVLTKPIIVILLLVTTYAGMVVAAGDWPSLSLTVWTLIGGAFAAGGSGAINQYIDRDIDAKMKRTQKRPLAQGRLTPAEGLAFGIGLCLLAFYFLAIFVNFLAAILSVVGMFYYVWLYSIVLKKSTVQNIVIGGGAGAIPPLVGWAAVTGGLTMAALWMFVIIFFWTPPHFWALALIRAKDYERGGIPMLPVVKGEVETRKQILIYTIELIAITLVAPLFKLGGTVYFIGAALLGAWLLSVAWRLWQEYSLKVAFKMYRYSSMYLAFLFAVLVIDAVL